MQDRDKLSTKIIGTCWNILLLIAAGCHHRFFSWGSLKGSVGPGWNGRHYLILVSSPHLSTIHAPEFPDPLVESPQEVSPEELPREDQLCKWDPLMKQSRVAEGMSVRKLAQETRIATAVIESL